MMLNKAGRKLLKRRKRLKVKVSVLIGDLGTGVTETRVQKLALRRR